MAFRALIASAVLVACSSGQANDLLGPAPATSEAVSTGTDAPTPTDAEGPLAPPTAPVEPDVNPSSAASAASPPTDCVRIADFESTNWFIVNDGVMGGRSIGDGFLEDGVLTFFGEIVTDGGGFSSLRSQMIDGLGDATHLRMRLRSDGRDYELLAEDVNSQDRRVTHYRSIPATGGIWEEVDVSLTEMDSRIFGNPVDAAPFDPTNATQIGIILSDGLDGEFQLEIDWIDACGPGGKSATTDQDADGSEAAAPLTSTTTSVPAPPRTMTMAFTGDVLIHSHIWRQAERNAAEAELDVDYDFTPMFEEIRPLIDGVDLAVCHLEVPLRLPGNEPTTHPIYGAPREIVSDLAAVGYDHCSTASNHTLDQGVEGVELTAAEFDLVGITQHGMARTPDEIEPSVRDITTSDGSMVATTLLSYTWSYNGLSTPADEPWRSALIEPDRVIADARQARELGAEFVVISLHWGAEKVSAVTRQQRDWASEITASGQVDLIVGHHAHVLQPIEEINGVWVVFGLGNVLSFHPTTDEWPAESQDAAVVTVEVTVDSDGARVNRPVVYPTWVDKSNGRVIRDVLAGLDSEETSAWRRGQLAASLERTERVVGGFIPTN
ncbi:MAG: CIA30 family protein [Ilumatobacteraceae bacterium]